MSEKKVGKRLLTWVLVLVMTLSLLPLNVLAEDGDNATIQSFEDEYGLDTSAQPKDGIVIKVDQNWANDNQEAGAVNKMKVRLVNSNTQALELTKDLPANGEFKFSGDTVTIAQIVKSLKDYVPEGYIFVGAFFYWYGSPPSQNEDFSALGVTHVDTIKNYKRNSIDQDRGSHLGFTVTDKDPGNDWHDSSGYYSYNPTGTLRLVYEKLQPSTDKVNDVWAKVICNVEANHNGSVSKDYKNLIDFNLGKEDKTTGERTLTISANPYISDFNNTYPGHSLTNANNTSKSIQMKYNDSAEAWVPVDKEDVPVTFEVACEELKVNVIFNANGGAWDNDLTGYKMNDNRTTASQEGLALNTTVSAAPAPAYGNKTFKGWGISTNATDPYLGFLFGSPTAGALARQFGQNGTVTFYAIWEETSQPSTDVHYYVYKHCYVGSEETPRYNQEDNIPRPASPSATIASLIEDADKADMVANGITYHFNDTKTKVGNRLLSENPDRIVQDGDIIHLYYYADATEYKLSYDSNVTDNSVTNMPDPTSVTATTISGYYDFEVSETVPQREGYTFTGWNTKADGTDTKVGGTITLIAPTTEVTLYAQWEKNSYKVSYQYTGELPTGAPKVPEVKEYAYQELVTIEGTPMLTGYTFHGWTLPEGLIATDGKFNMPAENVTITGYWTPNSGTKYTVEHYKQNLNNDNYTLAETESDKTGTTGDKTDAAAKSYDGFTSKPFDQQTIAGDGKTVVKIYYDRNAYTVTYTDGVDGNAFANDVHENVKYEGAIPDYKDIEPTREGYEFDKWDWYKVVEGADDVLLTAKPDTMPANDLKAVAQWTVKPITVDLNDLDGKDDGIDNAAVYKKLVISAGSNSLPSSFSTTFVATIKPDTNATGTMPDSYTGTATVTKDNHTKVPFKFAGAVINANIEEEPVPYGKLRFTEAGTYTYTVKETIPTNKVSGITYDDNTYMLTIKVAKGDDGLYVDNYYVGKEANKVPVTITNTYYKHTYHPRPNPTPVIEIPDDDALGLNTTDHFAYIVGYGNGEVRPQNNITRAEVATIFFRLLTDDVRDENLTKTNSYSDVAATAWYNTAVSTLSSMGIITGYPDGTFRPNAAITRAEFAAIAARFDPNGDKTAAAFIDIASHWAKDEISIAYNNGWITGYPDGTFGPQRDITRAETMTLVNRVLNRLPETEDDLLPNMTVWTDNANTKAWYYLAVQEATNSHYYEFKTNSQYEKWTELRETRDWTLLEK